MTRFFSKYDDIAPAARKAAERQRVEEIFDSTRSIDFQAVARPAFNIDSVADCLEALRERMRTAGLPTVYRYRFRLPSPHLSVVKVVVPRCEEDDSQHRRVGPRLAQRILANA